MSEPSSAAELRACLIIPAYNHAPSLSRVLSTAGALSLPILVVNDGSRDETAAVLARYPRVMTVAWERNRGKGAALAAGLARAEALGFGLAVTLDANGKYDPRETDSLLAVAGTETLVVGNRAFGSEAPPGGRVARAWANFWLWIETGYDRLDATSGFRVYPVKAIRALRIRSRRYGWETEALARAAWGGVKLAGVPVSVSSTRPPSHRRPVRDFLLLTLLNIYLVLRRLLPLPYRRVVTPPPLVWPPTWREKLVFVWNHFLWLPGETPAEAAISVAFGVAVGLSPLWGLHTLLAVYLAQRFHLNKILVLAASGISIPPMIPLIVYLSLVQGRLLLTGKLVWTFKITEFTLSVAKTRMLEYVLGSLGLSLLFGLSAGLAAYGCLKLIARRKGRETPAGV